MRHPLSKVMAGAALAVLCWGGAAAQTIVVGGKAFTEQQIMTAMTVALLKAKGFTPDRKAGMGSAAVRAALEVVRRAATAEEYEIAALRPQ